MDTTLLIAVLIIIVMVLILAGDGKQMNNIAQFLCLSIVGVTAYLFQVCMNCMDDPAYTGGAEKKKAATKKKAVAKKDATKKAAVKSATKKSSIKHELVSAGIIPVTKDGKKVLLTQTKGGMWTFVRGHMEGKKTAEDIAIASNKDNLGVTLKKADLKEKLTREYSFDVSKESYERHVARMKKRGEKPQIKGPGMTYRQQVYFVAPTTEQKTKINMEALKDAKWVSWSDAEKKMNEAPVSRQLGILKSAAEWAKANLK